jgi:hypothetical protein
LLLDILGYDILISDLMTQSGEYKKISQIWGSTLFLEPFLWLLFEVKHLLIDELLDRRVFRDEPLEESDEIDQSPDGDD